MYTSFSHVVAQRPWHLPHGYPGDLTSHTVAPGDSWAKVDGFQGEKMQGSLVDIRKKTVLLFSLQKVTTILPTLWPEVSALCASRNWLKGNVRTGGTWILPPSTQVFSCDKYFSPVSISSEKKLLKHDNLSVVELYMIYSISTYVMTYQTILPHTDVKQHIIFIKKIHSSFPIWSVTMCETIWDHV